MSDLPTFLKYIQNRITVNEKVLNSLTEILVSSELSTTIVNSPIIKSDYMHIDDTSYLYGRAAEPADMFGGLDANSSDYPVIDSFELGEFPDILNDDLSKTIKSLISINEVNELSFGTIYSTINRIKLQENRRILRNSIRQWGMFSIGSKWPASYGLSHNLKNNCTVETNTNKYSFLKLNPNIDAKTHYIKINSASMDVGSKEVPAVFVLLDSFDSVDGDEFQFKVSYEGGGSTSPAIMFFDSSYNSNAVPLPSIDENRDNGELKLNNSIKIDGVDYIYTKATNLPQNVLAEYKVDASEYVFVSKQESNQRILNSVGVELYDILGQNLTRKSYIAHGITESNSLVVYSTETLDIVSEAIDNIFTSTISKRLFIENSNATLTGSRLSFNGGGVSACFGRPASFFKADLTNTSLTIPQQYSNTLEGYPGNVLPQYKGEIIPGPDTNPDNNGLLMSFDVNLDNISSDSVAIRIGHFETAIALNLKLTASGVLGCFDGVVDSYADVNTSDNLKSFDFGSELTINCTVSVISINDILHIRSIIKNSTTVFDTGLIPLLPKKDMVYAKRALGSKYTSTIEAKFESLDLYANWSPVLTTVISGSTTTVHVSNFKLVHSLYKEELEMLNSRALKTDLITSEDYWNYGNVEGLFKTIVLKPEDVKGFICKIDGNSLNSYAKDSTQTSTDNSFRVGVTYNAYKGPVYVQRMLEYTPTKTVKSNKLTVDVNEDSIVNESTSSVFVNHETNQVLVLDLSSSDVDDVKQTVIYENPIEYSPDVAQISDDSNIDNVDGFFGWKINTLYQVIA